MQPNVLSEPLSRLLQWWHRGSDHPAKLRLWWGILRALKYPRLMVRDGQGLGFSVDCRDCIGGSLFTHGAYEPEVWATLAKAASHDEIFWDIGAHIGVFAIQAAHEESIAEVRAFEPNPRTLDILQYNAKLNTRRFAIHPVALSDKHGSADLFLPPAANTGLASLDKGTNHAGDTATVRCTTIDVLLSDRDILAPTLIKVDVEGTELAVFQGAVRLFQTHPPKCIVFETAVDSNGHPTTSAISLFLSPFCYRVARIPRWNNRIEARENFVAIHDIVHSTNSRKRQTL